MTKHILITRNIPDSGIAMLREHGYEVEINPQDNPPTQKEIIKLLKKKPYDAVISFLTDRIDAAVFDAAPHTKLYANYATGFDNIDLPEANRRGITVTNAPTEASSEAVAEHTVALMLALAARIVESDDYMRRKKYKGWSAMHFLGTNIIGKTLGLIGAGRIGSRTAHYAAGLGMKIVYTDVARNTQLEADTHAHFFATPEEILTQADIVSLHVPLLSSTTHLINEARLRLMKPTSYLVNTARGAVVDENALVHALKNNIIAGAGLDVFEHEPKLANGLTKLRNVILTPHTASASIEARDEMAKIAATNVIEFLEGRPVPNAVTK